MGSNDDLPDGAFTDLERAAGVPGIWRGGGRRFLGKRADVTEADCVSLIVHALVVGPADLLHSDIVHPDGEAEEDDFDLGHLNGLTPATASRSSFSVLAHGYRVPVPILLSALRSTGLPYFGSTGWLAWDESSKSLVGDAQREYGSRRRGFWSDGRPEPASRPDPEMPRVARLLRAAYLSSEYGAKPLLIRDEHLADALAKRVVPFDEVRGFSREQLDGWSLAYYTRFGDVEAVPLSDAYAEKVAVATRAGTLFPYRGSHLRPSLSPVALKANSFAMSVCSNCQRFEYYLRRSEGTVFESVFERIDLPSNLQFCTSEAKAVADSARGVAQWANERHGTVYLTADGHPLRSNDCESVTTVAMYASAVAKLDELAFRLVGNGSDVDVYATALGLHVASPDSPYAAPWKPASG